MSVSVVVQQSFDGGFTVTVAVNGATPEARACEWVEALEQMRRLPIPLSGSPRLAGGAAANENTFFDEARAKRLLTPRQFEVWRLMIQGWSNKEIATALTITVNTVQSHTHQVRARLELRAHRRIMRDARA